MADKKNNTGSDNSGDWNSGDWNSGDWNSGDRNSGDRNSGNWNSGNWNSGNWNSGDYNSGDYNSGDRNSGNYNSGNRNSGDRNSGDRNSGNWNSGNWNSGDYNSGYFNRNEPPLRLFEKDSEYTETTFRAKFGYQNINPILTEWIAEAKMSKEEKSAHPEFGNTGGYLKRYDYKEAWKTAWDKASQDDRNWFLNLLNFDAQIFFDITGIDVRESKKKSLSGKTVKVTVDGEEFTAIIQ